MVDEDTTDVVRCVYLFADDNTLVAFQPSDV
jgi:hypothetical protein